MEYDYNRFDDEYPEYPSGSRGNDGAMMPQSRSRRKTADSSYGAYPEQDRYASGSSRSSRSGYARQEDKDAVPSGPSRGRKNGGSGKGKEPKSRRSTLITRVVIFAILEVFAVIGILGMTKAIDVTNGLNKIKINEQNILNFNLSEEQRAEMEKGYWNIAVFGVDTRNSSMGKGANSDVIIVVSINRETGAIQLVSVFRDTYLKTGENTYNKINSAYCQGGPEQALKALNENLDLNITQYVTFSWKAVATGINILGGVDIELSKAEYNWINGYITETVNSTGIGSTQLTGPGMHHLDGVQAVAYARLRYMDNDYARTERQRKVIGEVFKKAKQTDISTLNSLIGVMLELVSTNMTWQDGLDAIANITKYNITETAGFPFARGEANLGKCGACVIPQTLESNDRDLHTMLFPDDTYEPSDQVKQISAYISAKTGMYSEGVNVGHVSTEGWISSGSGKSGTGAVSEETEPAEAAEAESITKKNDKKEYAISKDGYLIYVDGVDENGNKIYKYMLDADGKRIKMVEKDENGNLVYLYEIDEDGNFYFTQNEELNETEAEVYETDEDGNILPGQGPDTQDGPGGAAGTEGETATDQYGKPVSDSRNEYGPGSQAEEEGEVYPGADEDTRPGGGSGTDRDNTGTDTPGGSTPGGASPGGPGGSDEGGETVENMPR